MAGERRVSASVTPVTPRVMESPSGQMRMTSAVRTLGAANDVLAKMIGAAIAKAPAIRRHRDNARRFRESTGSPSGWTTPPEVGANVLSARLVPLGTPGGSLQDGVYGLGVHPCHHVVASRGGMDTAGGHQPR